MTDAEKIELMRRIIFAARDYLSVPDWETVVIATAEALNFGEEESDD